MTVILWGCVLSCGGSWRARRERQGLPLGGQRGQARVGKSGGLLQRFTRPTLNLTSSFQCGAASLFSSDKELSIRSGSCQCISPLENHEW